MFGRRSVTIYCKNYVSLFSSSAKQPHVYPTSKQVSSTNLWKGFRGSILNRWHYPSRESKLWHSKMTIIQFVFHWVPMTELKYLFLSHLSDPSNLSHCLIVKIWGIQGCYGDYSSWQHKDLLCGLIGHCAPHPGHTVGFSGHWRAL